MEIKSWEDIYKKYGEVQSEVLPQVQEAARLFQNKKYQVILDLCCGTGRHAIFLAKKGFLVYATDISQTGIEITRKKIKSLQLKNIILLKHDMRYIPFRDHIFDGVNCIWSTGHGKLIDIQKNINEMHRVLKGTLVADFISVEDESCGKGEEIEPNTFIGSMEGEEGIIHHYSTREELESSFSKFEHARIIPVVQTYKDESGKQHSIKKFDVIANK